MGKAKRLSRDLKRKLKLKKRAAKAEAGKSLAYRGSKYKNKELIPAFFQAEVAIYEAFVISDRSLTDKEVVKTLESKILQLRGESPPPLDTSSEEDDSSDEAGVDFLTWNIEKRWEAMSSSGSLLNRENRIGILRSILNSISIWSAKSGHSQGYLRFLEGFLTKKLGVRVQKLPADHELIDDESDDDDLFELGRAWLINGDLEAKEDFHDLAGEMIEDGDAEYVAGICEELRKEARNGTLNAELQGLAARAQLMIGRG